ncbi:hypothetical protein [Desulfonatronovibrio magnus]|uniref:hypothetical protein n=1 Tax=Desulfonatronovibrio magnus TaxID=698827 RepID=UPI0005EADAB2|nr:hypothetical protein [Desulfonatronovibrio magnus]
MNSITASSLNNPVQQYASIQNKTSSGKSHLPTRVESVQKSFGFKWKSFGIEYQSEDISIEEPARLSKSFMHELREASQINSLPAYETNSHYGPLQPKSAASAYARQWQAPLEYIRPMINVAV